MYFTEWVKHRVDEASHDRLAARDYRSSANISQETFERDQMNPDQRVNYVVITNAVGLLRDLIKSAKAGGNVNPDQYTSFKIESINGDQITMKRNTSQTYSSGQVKTIPISAIDEFEVTDAFRDNGIIGNNKTRYFLSASRSGVGPRLKELMQNWLSLTKHNTLGDTDQDRQTAAVGHFLGGDEHLKSKINQGANDAKTKMWQDFDSRAQRGEDVTKIAMDASHDDTSGANRLDSEGFQGFLRAVAPNVYTQLRLNGHIGQVSPDERRLLNNLQQIDSVVKAGYADQVLANNPEVDWIVDNPDSIKFGYVMGFPHAANWIRKNGSSDSGFFARIGQNKNQSLDPRSFKGPQDFQSQDQFNGPKNPSPSPLDALLSREHTLRENIQWRRHNDKKVYTYY